MPRGVRYCSYTTCHWDGRYAARGGDLGATSCGNRELGSEVVRVRFDTEFGNFGSVGRRSVGGWSSGGWSGGAKAGRSIGDRGFRTAVPKMATLLQCARIKVVIREIAMGPDYPYH